MKLHQKEISQDKACSEPSLILTEEEHELVCALWAPRKRTELVHILEQSEWTGYEWAGGSCRWGLARVLLGYCLKSITRAGNLLLSVNKISTLGRAPYCLKSITVPLFDGTSLLPQVNRFNKVYQGIPPFLSALFCRVHLRHNLINNTLGHHFLNLCLLYL